MPDALFLRPIRPGDDTGKFSLGTPEAQPLKSFLKKQAKDYHHKNVAKTFVLVDSPDDSRVLGYLTLVCSEIKNEASTRLDDCGDANKYTSFPAIKIARLAVHNDLQRGGYGRTVMDWCIRHVVENIMPHAGCRFLVADAKHSAVSFYKKCGFTLLESEDKSKHPIMFVDLHKLKTALTSAQK